MNEEREMGMLPVSPAYTDFNAACGFKPRMRRQAGGTYDSDYEGYGKKRMEVEI